MNKSGDDLPQAVTTDLPWHGRHHNHPDAGREAQRAVAWRAAARSRHAGLHEIRTSAETVVLVRRRGQQSDRA